MAFTDLLHSLLGGSASPPSPDAISQALASVGIGGQPQPAQPAQPVPDLTAALQQAGLSGGGGADTLMGGSRAPFGAPPAPARQGMATSVIPNAQYPASYNDHSTRDKWAELLGGLIPSLAPLANHIVATDRARNQSFLQRQSDTDLMGQLQQGSPAAAASAASASAAALKPANPAQPGDIADTAAPAPVQAAGASYDASPQGAMAYFAPKYGKVVAAAIAGNFGPESAGWNPKAFNPAGGGHGAFGLAQWRGPRLAALQAFAQQTGQDVNDPKTQYQFADYELNTSHAGVLKALQGVQDPGQAAAMFSKLYEAPGDVPKAYTDRITREAAQAAALYGNGAPPPPPPPPDPNGPAVQSVASAASAAADTETPTAADTAAPADASSEPVLRASKGELTALAHMLANPATHDDGVKYAVKLMQQYASPDYEAAINQNSGQVIHYSKNPDVPAIVENVAGVHGAPPSSMMWDPNNPGRVIPIPGTERGPLQSVPGLQGVVQRDPDGSFHVVGQPTFGGGIPSGGALSPPSARSGASTPAGQVKTPVAGIPGAYRVQGATGIWIDTPTGEPKRIADDGQSAVAPPGDATHTGVDYLKTLSAPQQTMVKALAEGRQPFPSGFALRSPYWQQMIQAVAQYDPSFDAVNYGTRAKTRNDFANGASAKSITAFNTAINHAADLYSLIPHTAALGGFPGAQQLNAAGNAYLNSSGAPGVTKWNQTAGTLSQELTKAYAGSGGAEADVKRFVKDLDINGSDDQKRAAIQNISELLMGKLDALQSQYKQGMGTTAQPLQMLSPRVARFVQQLQSEKRGSPSLPTLTPAQASQLPPGTHFRGADGIERIRH